MHIPEPTQAHVKLAQFVGSWTIEETMLPSPWDPKGGKADGRSDYRMGPGGFFLIAEYQQLREGLVTFEGHGVYGWDPRAEKFTMHWFDSMGGDPGAPALGEWTDDTLIFQHETAMGRARYTYRWESADRFTFRIENARDGASWVAFLDSVYTRSSRAVAG